MRNIYFYIKYKDKKYTDIILSLSDFLVDMFNSKLKQQLEHSYRLLCQTTEGNLRHISKLSIAEIEEIFNNDTNIINNLIALPDMQKQLSKELIKKYTQSNTKETTYTTIYTQGDVIRNNGETYLYIGKVKNMEFYKDSKLLCACYGHMYMPLEEYCSNKYRLEREFRHFLKDAIVSYETDIFSKLFFRKTKMKASCEYRIEHTQFVLSTNTKYKYTTEIKDNTTGLKQEIIIEYIIE